VLDPDGLVTEIQIPKPPDGAGQNSLKFTLSNPIDVVIVSVALVITTEEVVSRPARNRPWDRAPSACSGKGSRGSDNWAAHRRASGC
jgi:hypothetical protein